MNNLNVLGPRRMTPKQLREPFNLMPMMGDKPHAPRIPAHQHSEAVVFDFVQPASPSGRLVGWAGQAWLAEVGEGYATQQHGV